MIERATIAGMRALLADPVAFARALFPSRRPRRYQAEPMRAVAAAVMWYSLAWRLRWSRLALALHIAAGVNRHPWKHLPKPIASFLALISSAVAIRCCYLLLLATPVNRVHCCHVHGTSAFASQTTNLPS